MVVYLIIGTDSAQPNILSLFSRRTVLTHLLCPFQVGHNLLE